MGKRTDLDFGFDWRLGDFELLGRRSVKTNEDKDLGGGYGRGRRGI